MDPRRRAIVKAGVGLGIQLCAASTVSAQDTPPNSRPKEGDLFVKDGDAKATPLRPEDIPTRGPQTMAWSMDPADNTLRNGSRFNRVMLIRLDPDKLSEETKGRAADGVVAYTAICTHAGCEVSDWVAADQRLFCPCHDSTFDPADGGKVLDGPAPRALPALPLKVTDGKLTVAKPFTGRIGFEVA
jgi:rieske iron-sulfur protein